MKFLRQLFVRVLSVILVLESFALCAAKNEKLLYTFLEGTDGALPAAPLIADAQGNLYGTTESGGNQSACQFGGQSNGCGVVFELLAPASPTGTWTEIVLYKFSGGADGSLPLTALTFDKVGNIYGTTNEGGDIGNPNCSNRGCGVVFELSPPTPPGGIWTETVLHTFEGGMDGMFPGSPLVFDSAGNMYGTAVGGGSNSVCTGCGVAYELSPAGGTWAETVIYTFSGLADGLAPLGNIALDKVGNLYGTTPGGSTNSPGTAFELSPTSSGQPWIETTLGHPTGGATGLFLGKDGNFYGATTGSNLVIGTIYQLTKASGSWTENIIYSFNTQTGALGPNMPILDSKLNIYFTTQGSNCGGVFKLTAMPGNMWAPSELFGFSRLRLNQGCFPTAALVFGKWGALYGTTLNGGAGSGLGNGVIFGVLP